MDKVFLFLVNAQLILLHDPFKMNFFTVSENVFQPVIAKAGFVEHWL